MTQIKIRMPHELERFVYRQVNDGTYPSAGDYVCALIREARLETARGILDELQRQRLNCRRAVPGGPEP